MIVSVAGATRAAVAQPAKLEGYALSMIVWVAGATRAAVA
jgi:hypothetical protein